MNIDRVIFTSAESLTARGYRIAGATEGVTADERSYISRRSPSHESLCDKSESAVGFSGYPLASGRYCVTRSCCAGREQSGRGGNRILTHIFVLSPGQLAAFGWNPFGVLRALQSAKAFDIGAKTPTMLEPASVEPATGGERDRVVGSFGVLREAGFVYLLTRALQKTCVIVGDTDEPAAAIEGLLLTMPVPLRMGCDFSIGLKFAIARRYRINWLGRECQMARHHIRGQHIELVERLPEAEFPSFDPPAWARMVVDCRRASRLQQLLELTAMDFDDTSDAVLGYAADRQVAMNHLHERSIEELLDGLGPADYEPEFNIERHVDRLYRADATRRLGELLKAAPHEVVHTHWPRLAELAEVDPQVEALCGSLLAGMERAEPTATPCPDRGVTIVDRPVR